MCQALSEGARERTIALCSVVPRAVLSAFGATFPHPLSETGLLSTTQGVPIGLEKGQESGPGQPRVSLQLSCALGLGS